MKACPACGRLYPADAGFCPADGQGLQLAADVPPKPSKDPRIGSLVAARYELRRVVADGGMGRVYEALDTHEQRRVAVKMLHDDVARDPVAVERFKREFDVSKQLPHEHIVDVLDFRQDTGTFALVMEFLDGEELRTLLKREKTLSPGRVVRMVAQVALALAPAHAGKLIHRDLKPDNVFLCGTREGDEVKILDFGSVKDKSAGAKKLTMLGTTIGSPFYMAPEQAQGLDSLDERADVWAVAAIAYECLTGTVPFTGTNGPTILLAILTKEPALASSVTASSATPVPRPVDDVMRAAFSKNPAGRIPSVLALAERLGGAYGLPGDARAWAATPVHELDRLVAERLPALLAAEPAVRDPFTSVAPPASSDDHAMSEAFARDRLGGHHGHDGLAGVPGASPRWVIPVAVGVACLVAGAVVAVLIK